MRHLIYIDYDGTKFKGWQKQSFLTQTIQDYVENALSRVANERINLHAAGRTDSGVHAINMSAHFDSDVHRNDYSWIQGTNSYLPREICVHNIQTVSDEFHARSSAITRNYRYLLYVGRRLPPFLVNKVGWYFQELDVSLMQQSAQVLIGQHDFSSFRCSECQSPSPIKTIYHIDIRIVDDIIVFDFKASGFLHHMVRNIMGALIESGRDKLNAEKMKELLLACDRTLAPPMFLAEGLYFTGVEYDEKFNIQKPVLPNWFIGGPYKELDDSMIVENKVD